VTESRREPRPERPSTGGRLLAAVRASRERKGWTRERLAHESGLSFAAITQIETGRRADVRVSSLVALAAALEVSIDYLVRDDVAAPMLQHRAYVYDAPEHLARAVAPLAAGGLEAGHTVLFVAPAPALTAIRKALGTDAKRVTCAESSDWYTSAIESTGRISGFVRDARNDGADWVDVFGEPVWSGSKSTHPGLWTRYESLLNLIFAPWPVSVGCLYDARRVPAQVRTDLQCTHPDVVIVADSSAASETQQVATR
jgi:transcriptional regulator with XRE-family HTH domain